MSFLFEHTSFGKLRDQPPVILGRLRDLEIFEMVAGEQLVQILPSGSWVIRYERIGNILATQIQERDFATGMLFCPL
ncbi:hypothetical protein GQ457_15G019330 [Hibiscus cannabinus]